MALAAFAVDRAAAPPLPAVVPLLLGGIAAFQAVAADLLHRASLRAAASVGARRQGAPGTGGALGPALAAWVLDQVIVAYGLVLALQGAGPPTWGAFCAVGGVLLWLHRPRGDASAQAHPARRAPGRGGSS
jgi:hypothetical protein